MTTFIFTKLLLYKRFETNFKLSSTFYCCISKLKNIFIDQEPNPGPLAWKATILPLSHANQLMLNHLLWPTEDD